MQRLYLLDDSGIEDECGSQEIESTQEEVENLKESETEETPEISLHAMAGTTSPQTMRLRGHLGRQLVVILIDSGSTHNFIDPTASKKAGISIHQNKAVEVMVANGDRLTGTGFCKEVSQLIQEIPIVTEFYLWKLEGCEIVLKAH